MKGAANRENHGGTPSAPIALVLDLDKRVYVSHAEGHAGSRGGKQEDLTRGGV